MKEGKAKKIIQNIIMYITLGILIWGCIEEYKDMKIKKMGISKIGDYEAEEQTTEGLTTEKQAKERQEIEETIEKQIAEERAD